MKRNKIRKTVIALSTITMISLTGCSDGSNSSTTTNSGNSVVNTIDVNDNAEDGLNSKGEQLVPENINSNGSFRITNSDNLKEDSYRLDMFVDASCGACQMVEFELGEDLVMKAENGDIDYYITHVPFLDDDTVGSYSTRAANAFVTIAEENPVQAAKFMQKIYEPVFFPSHGPAHKERSDKEILEVAESVGVSKEVLEKITELHYVDWLTENTNDLMDNTTIFPNGITTPTTILGLDTNPEIIQFSGSIREDFDSQVQEYINSN